MPLVGLAILLAAAGADVHWQHNPSHFWLVLVTAGLNAALAYATGAAARRRGDGRVHLVSLAFLAAAGFLGLHALATPRVLLDKSNLGFAISTPIGLSGRRRASRRSRRSTASVGPAALEAGCCLAARRLAVASLPLVPGSTTAIPDRLSSRSSSSRCSASRSTPSPSSAT